MIFYSSHVAFKQIKKQLCEFCNERRYFVFNFKTSYLCKKKCFEKILLLFYQWILKSRKVVIFTWAVHNSFRFVGMISKLQILPRIETKTTRESISFGIVSWETLGKTYCLQILPRIQIKISAKAISLGVVSWETLSKTYCTADPSQNSNKEISKGNFSWRSELGDFKENLLYSRSFPEFK